MIKFRLSELLTERDLNLLQLSQRAKVRYATLWAMRNQKVVKLNLKILEKVCRALDCRLEELIVLPPKRSVKKGKKSKKHA